MPETGMNQPVPDPTEEAAHEANLFLAIFSAVVILIVGLLITHLLHTGCACEAARSPQSPGESTATPPDTHGSPSRSPIARETSWRRRTCSAVKRAISSIPEACALILLGFTLGAFLYLVPSTDFDEILENLNESFGKLFFVMLLPPVIFESGYSMDKVGASALAGSLPSQHSTPPRPSPPLGAADRRTFSQTSRPSYCLHYWAQQFHAW